MAESTPARHSSFVISNSVLPILDRPVLIFRFALRFPLQNLLVALLRVQQPLRLLRRHLPRLDRLAFGVLLVLFFAFLFLRGQPAVAPAVFVVLLFSVRPVFVSVRPASAGLGNCCDDCCSAAGFSGCLTFAAATGSAGSVWFCCDCCCCCCFSNAPAFSTCRPRIKFQPVFHLFHRRTECCWKCKIARRC